MSRIARVIIGLTLVGCSTADSEPVTVRLADALTVGTDGTVDPTESPFIEFDGHVAVIRVDRCDEGCKTLDVLGRAVFIQPQDGTHKNFDNVIWYAAVTAPSYDPDAPWLGDVPAAIAGPVYYGVSPTGAAYTWPEQVEPLVEGPVYAVNVSRFIPCPADEDCDRVESTSGVFFKVEHGDLIEVAPDQVYD